MKKLEILKKTIKIILLTILTVYFLATVFAIVVPTFFMESFVESLGNRDTISILGGGQFELAKINDHIVLQDERLNKSLTMVYNVENYTTEDDYLYVVGDYSSGYAIAKDGAERPSSYLDLKTGEYIRYRADDSIPRYLILNVKTAELKTYVTLNEVPEIDRQVFEKIAQKKK